MGRFVIIGLILLGIGGFVLISAMNTERADQRLDAGGITTAGTVMNATASRGRRGSRSYNLDVQYATPDRKVIHRRRFPVSKAVYEATGDAVHVTFLPNDPEVARIGGHRNNAVGTWIGGALTAAGLAVFGFLFLLRRKARTTGPATTAWPGGATAASMPQAPLPPLPPRGGGPQ